MSNTPSNNTTTKCHEINNNPQVTSQIYLKSAVYLCNQLTTSFLTYLPLTYLPPTERFTLSGWLSSLYAAISANTSIGGAICTEEKFCEAIISCDHPTNSCTLQQYTLFCAILCAHFLNMINVVTVLAIIKKDQSQSAST